MWALYPFLHLVCFPGVLDECHDGHRSDTSWNGGDRADVVLQVFEVSISSSYPIDEGRSHIDHDTFTCHHILREESRMSCRDDDDIRPSRDLRKVQSRTIATRHGGSLIHEHEGHRLADDIRSTNDTDIFSLHIDIVV